MVLGTAGFTAALAIYKFEKNIQSVTPKNIKDALKEVLLDENFITVVVGNENPF